MFFFYATKVQLFLAVRLTAFFCILLHSSAFFFLQKVEFVSITKYFVQCAKSRKSRKS